MVRSCVPKPNQSKNIVQESASLRSTHLNDALSEGSSLEAGVLGVWGVSGVEGLQLRISTLSSDWSRSPSGKKYESSYNIHLGLC